MNQSYNINKAEVINTSFGEPPLPIYITKERTHVSVGNAGVFNQCCRRKRPSPQGRTVSAQRHNCSLIKIACRRVQKGEVSSGKGGYGDGWENMQPCPKRKHLVQRGSDRGQPTRQYATGWSCMFCKLQRATSHLLLGVSNNLRLPPLFAAATFRRGRDSCGREVLFSFLLAEFAKRVIIGTPAVFGSAWICGRCGMAVPAYAVDMRYVRRCFTGALHPFNFD